MREVYMFMWGSKDEDGKVERGLDNMTEHVGDYSAEEWSEQLANFIGQTDETYIDKWGVVHEIYNDVDQPFAYCFNVEDGDWQEVVGDMGFYLDDSENKDMPEDIRQGFEDIYNHAKGEVAKAEARAKYNERQETLKALAEHKGWEYERLDPEDFDIDFE